ACSSSGGRGRDRARSSSPFRIPRGVRSSWLASSTKRRSRSNASWSRSSISFSVLASRATSSPVAGTRRRRSGDVEISAASRRIRSTGRSAAPARAHPAAEVIASATGPPITRRASSRSRAAVRTASEVPTTTNRRPPPPVTGSTSSRLASGTPATCRMRNVGRPIPRSAEAASSGRWEMASVDSSRRPEWSSTWAKESVGLTSAPGSSPKLTFCRSIPAATTCARDRSPRSIARSSSEPSRRYRKAPRPARIPAMPRAKASVSRSLIGSLTSPSLPQAVAGTPHGLDRPNAEGPVDLLPEVAHVDVDDVRVSFVGEVPDVVQDLRSREHGSRVPHEVLEERVLLCGEVDRGVAPLDDPGGGIEGKVAHPKDGGTLERSAAHQRAEPRGELAERKGFREVVVGTRVEPPHAVLERVAGGQHEDRGPHPSLAEPAADLESVHVRQHDVQDDRVGRGLGAAPQRVLARLGDGDRVALFLKAALEEPRHSRRILHHEHAHRVPAQMLRLSDETEMRACRPAVLRSPHGALRPHPYPRARTGRSFGKGGDRTCGSRDGWPRSRSRCSRPSGCGLDWVRAPRRAPTGRPRGRPEPPSRS